MEIASTIYDGKIVGLDVEGDIDAYTARTLDKTLKDLFDQGYCRLVIDISKVSLINSTGLRSFLFAHREATKAGGGVRLAGPNSQIRRIFEISGLSDMLKISETFQDALTGW